MGIPAQVAAGAPSVPTDGTRVGPEYLRTLGVPILEGREGPVVINQKLAQALWPNQSALGRTFLLGTNSTPLEVAGVVPDGAFNGVGEDGSFSGLAKSERRPFIFIADRQIAPAAQDRTFHIRYRGALADLVPAVRAVIHRTDPRLTVFSVRTMQAEWEDFTSPIRVLVTLVGCFAVGGLFVASIGLYAVVAFYTRKRTRELGIRTALGASPAQAARLIVKEGLLLTAAGLAVGLAICGSAGRAFAHLLFGVTPTDATTWLAVMGLLTVVSLGACWLPARRAARVEPMLALRQD
jgi:hypothetical protein